MPPNGCRKRIVSVTPSRIRPAAKLRSRFCYMLESRFRLGPPLRSRMTYLLRLRACLRIGSPSPFPSPPRRGEARWLRWDDSLISEGPAVLERVSLSPGERAGVRASVLPIELFRPRALRFVLASALFLSGTTTFVAQQKDAEQHGGALSVSFTHQIAPILARKCLTCHGPEKSKGGFRLDTFELLLKPGESKSASLVSGNPQQSELFRRITIKDEDDRMPQKADPLPDAEIVLIERWIKEGARFDGADSKAPLVSLVPRMPHPDPPANYARPVPVMALAFGRDGQELAIGGYHEITIWNPGDGKLLRRITNVAQRTQSLAYSPAGVLAAAGGSPGQ